MRVLIIEDNPDIAANLGDYLEDHGHTVDFAGDGVTGLHLAVVNEFDSIVLDLALPGMDGLEVCRKLRLEAGKDTPVLMLTARDRLEDKLAGFETGADGVTLVESQYEQFVIAEIVCLYSMGATQVQIVEALDHLGIVNRYGNKWKQPQVCRIVKKYINSPNFLPVISNQKTNDYLKEICKIVLINETPINEMVNAGNETHKGVPTPYTPPIIAG